MKGPAIFLASAAAVGAVFLVVISPALGRRAELRERVLAVAAPAGESEKLDRATERLTRAAGYRDADEAVSRVREIVSAHAVGALRKNGPREFAFGGRIDDVPALLADLEPVAGSLASVTVHAESPPGRCRVILVLAPR